MEHNLTLYCVDYILFDCPLEIYHMGLQKVDVVDGTTIFVVRKSDDAWAEYALPSRRWLDKGDFSESDCEKIALFLLRNERMIMDEVRGIE